MLTNRLEKYGLGGECKQFRSGAQSKHKPWVKRVVDKGRMENFENYNS